MPYVSHIRAALSIPDASLHVRKPPYPEGMGKKLEWRHWGARFRNEASRKKISTREAALRVDQAESTVRSWLNGTREVNLADFVRLCDATGIDPELVLFADVGKLLAAWRVATNAEKESLLLMSEAILRRHEDEASGRRRGVA